MISIVGNIINAAVQDLFIQQPDILNTTSQTTMTEWNIAHHLSNSIKKYLFWYDNDNDVVKRHYDNKRPDMIFHKRISNANNFLVVELKMGDVINDNDVTKIKEDWFNGELHYSFGACISINRSDNYILQVFENGSRGKIELNNLNPRQYSINSTIQYEEIFELRSRMDRHNTIGNDEIELLINRKFT